ncbi:SAM-dependent methyltransferase [Paraglaciecola arctica]|uniref:Uroporphyrin-III C/tetrapyrrole methyltransferase n=1 Tax=Paraglaciecola arctica BSs20135 TaxID=493475 RepID=K6YN78_9ALTE|nr:SAM-dependent methyltransferase [Paraglaciecola arctica]GAC18098.1 uroporphyrin-III C/tetrapyrrole methyltransferase [Paraglaciecola arctica BSs20135]
MSEINKTGSIVCVSTGMTLGAHMSPICRSHIEQADVVFAACHPMIELWLQEMNSDVRSMQQFYGEGKDRRITYREMVAAMMSEVRAGKKVVGAFYGHTGVFAWAPHKVIEEAKAEGYAAHMEPGISAEDCLYAHLGIDPGTYGCQNFEASQFMFYQRNIDPSAYLILWQVAIAGDKTVKRFSTGPAYRQLLIELLTEHYPLDHKVALYECPTLAIDEARIDWIPLSDFTHADISLITTMVIPPSKKMHKNQQILDRLAELDKKFQ